MYVFSCIPSNERLDGHFTYMDPTTIRQYIADVNTSTIPVMNSHATGGGRGAELPIGRAFWADEDTDPQLEGRIRMVSDSYMLRNNSSSGTNTNELIASMKAGILSDISIQFYLYPGTLAKSFTDRTWLKCSICGSDWLRASYEDCNHWPGEVYGINGGDSKELCTLAIVNGHLLEYSTVFRGSCPGAITLKAQEAMDTGHLARSLAMNLESLYNVRLLGNRFQVPGLKEGDTMAEGQAVADRTSPVQAEAPVEAPVVEAQVDLEEVRVSAARDALSAVVRVYAENASDLDEGQLAQLRQIQSALTAGDIEEATAELGRLILGDPSVAVEAVSRGGSNILDLSTLERRQFAEFRKQAGQRQVEIERLKPLAEVGTWYRDTLIEATAKQAVRSGMSMDEDSCRTMLGAVTDMEVIRSFHNQYKRIGDGALGQVNEDGAPLFTGGAQTARVDPNGQSGGDASLVRRSEAGAYR